MGFFTLFCPLTTTGPGELVVQTADEPRFVVDCNVNPAALVGHVKITLAPEGAIVSCGGPGSVRLNTVPELLVLVPPPAAVPDRVLPNKINPACGLAPSLPPVKLYSVVKPMPSVLTANTVPWPKLPPSLAVPYRVLPDKIKPAHG